jgi:TonB family protein
VTSVVRPIMLRKLPRFVLFVHLALITNPVARAQSSENQTLAAGMSNALTRGKVRTVVVFDFMGSDGKLTQLGQDLADAFGRTLAASGGQFEVIDRTLVRPLILKNRIAPDVIRDPETAWWLANQLTADAVIVGVLTPLYGSNLKIEVKSADTKDGRNIGSMSVKVPLTDEMKTALSNSLSVDHMKDRLDPKSPKGLLPKCIYCPRPEYSSGAVAQKIEGRITFIVQITEKGIATDIEFVKGLPNGLTQRAIEAVQKWKFEPSHDPEGKPRAVWEVIEITFHLG